MNVNYSTALQTSESNLTKETESIEKFEIFVEEGRGLTIEICNNGDIDAENIAARISPINPAGKIFTTKLRKM